MIDKDTLLEKITVDEIIDILQEFGGHVYKTDNNGDLYFNTICHGGESHKLHFFKDSKCFMCYTNCGSMSFYDLLMNVNDWSFKDAYRFLCKYKGIDSNSKGVGLRVSKSTNSDLEFLDRHLYKPKKQNISLPQYDKSILNIFEDYYPDEWIEEGISEEIMQYYDIKFYFNQYKAIIPHFDYQGNLIGIRSRSFFQEEIDAGRKYVPIKIQGLTYRYPTHFNLYGLYQNKENIKKYKKAMLFESEKSVLKYASIYGQENNISVSSQGMTLSLYQRDLLLQQGIEELVIAYDKQYMIEYINEENKNTKQYKEYIKFLKNLFKITKMFINYCKVSIILCWDNRIDYKDCPIDKGKEIFEELSRERYYITDLSEIEEMIE